RARRVEAIERVDDEVAVAQPAVAVVPVAARAGGLGNRRRDRGDDRAGVVAGVLLQRDRRADHLVLPFERDGEAAHPVAPGVGGLVDEAARELARRLGDRRVLAEDQRDVVLQQERLLLGDRRERRVGGEAQRLLAERV